MESRGNKGTIITHITQGVNTITPSCGRISPKHTLITVFIAKRPYVLEQPKNSRQHPLIPYNTLNLLPPFPSLELEGLRHPARVPPLANSKAEAHTPSQSDQQTRFRRLTEPD